MSRMAWLFLLVSTAMSAQSSDSQTLQALLQELRQLRQDMHGLTLVGQRVQILLYRVQLQDDVTKRATQRYNQANAKTRDAERAYGEAVNDLKKAEERISTLQNPKERDEGESVIREMKRRVEMWGQDQSSNRAGEIAAESEAKTEQAKLSELQQRLERLEKQLEAYAPAPR